MRTIGLTALGCLAFAAAALAGDGPLPAPKKDGGPSTLAALEARHSGKPGGFTQAVTTDELSTLLWAAAGRNRNGQGWTVPTAMGRDPYVTLYVADATGTYRYDGKDHALVAVGKKDVRAELALQDFAKTAPTLIVAVLDGAGLAAFGDADRGLGFGYVLVGSMTQNLYLAAEAVGAEVRYIASVNADAAKRELKLQAADRTVCILPVGRP